MESWAQVPWSAWPAEDNSSPSFFHKHQVPYKSNANALQNLEVWIPSTTEEVPEAKSLPTSSGVWIIYIHGGAWRDENVTSASFNATVSNLAKSHSATLPKIGGIASINYSLSPRSTDPKNPLYTDDNSRQAHHPDHIIDVLTGLDYLQSLAKFDSNYILLGHSCGATLAFQVAMENPKWSSAATGIKTIKPAAIVGLNGLYDMPTLIREPGDKHAKLQQLYENFTVLAFSEDTTVWKEISPVFVEDWAKEWPEGKKAVLVQSHEDTLVPYWQLADMQEKLGKSKAAGLGLTELSAGGDHNDLWKEGVRLAEIVEEVVKSLA